MIPSGRTRKPIGTIILRTTGYRFLKTNDGKWQPEHRVVAAQRILHRDLEKNERVYRRDGDRNNNAPSNLVVLKFSLVKRERLEHSRVLYIPPQKAGRQLVAA